MIDARKIVHDEDLARDAVQEALLSLWLEAVPPANPAAWLFRAVRNRSLHLARGRHRRERHESNARRLRVEASHRDDPSQNLEREDWNRAFAGSLNQLSEDHRKILVLSLIRELDYGSIARELGIPIGTVRSRLNRARQALQGVLIRFIPDEERFVNKAHASA